MKKRGFGVGKWNGFGGKLHDGENVIQAALREITEEAGITPAFLTSVAVIDFSFADKPEWDQQVHVFTAKKWAGDPTETEEMAPQWFSYTNIPYTSMWPDDIFWLPQVLSGKTLTAQFAFDADQKLVGHLVKLK